MRLIAYRLTKEHTGIVVAASKRTWMDEWPKKHPYRCWPLTVTNGYGWEMICGSTFTATWNGGAHQRDVRIERDDDGAQPFGRSHFGRGTITFFPGCLLRSEAPYQLFVTGPLNRPKDGVTPLSAIVETAWLPFTFAMTYVLTRPNLPVRFEAGEPFCQFFPLDSRAIEKCEPEWRDIESDRVLWKQFHEWRLAHHIVHGKVPGISVKRSFETRYQRGILPDGTPIIDTPPMKYAVRAFADGRSPKSSERSTVQPIDRR